MYAIRSYYEPGLTEEKLYNRIARDFENEPKRIMKNVLRRLLPEAMIKSVLEKARITSYNVCYTKLLRAYFI